MTWGGALQLLAAFPGRVLLQPDCNQVQAAWKLRKARAAADAEPEPLRGMPVFTVPGIYLILPSRRGKVRCMPLFLSKQHVDRIACYVQDVLIHTWRLKRRHDRRAFRMAAESAAAQLTGLQGRRTLGRSHGRDADEAAGAYEVLEELGKALSHQKESAAPTGIAANVSRLTVGMLSLALRGYEAGANIADGAISSLGLDVRVAGLRRPPVVLANTLREHVTACGRWNAARRPGRAGGSRPWSAEDLADLEINVEAAVDATVEAAAEWQQKGKNAKMKWEFSEYFGSLSDTSSQQASAASSPDTKSLSTAAALDISKAIGETPVDAEESADVRDIPNRGVILFGENGPNANRAATQLQLPFGRKLKVPTVSVADGNVLCWAG